MHYDHNCIVVSNEHFVVGRIRVYIYASLIATGSLSNKDRPFRIVVSKIAIQAQLKDWVFTMPIWRMDDGDESNASDVAGDDGSESTAISLSMFECMGRGWGAFFCS